MLKTLTIAVVGALLGSAGALAQTAEEKTKLAALGDEGFVVYAVYNGGTTKEDKAMVTFRPDRSSIWRYELDGTGEPKPRKIVDRGVYPTLSRDGTRLAWLDWTDSKACDIWVANADGSSKRKLATVPYAASLKWNNSDRLLVATDERSGRSTGHYPGQLALVSLDGKVKVITDLSKYTGGYMFIGDMDMHDNWIVYRWDAKVFVGKWDGTSERNFRGTRIVSQGCGMSFAPSGKQLIVNDVPHTGISLWELNGSTWSQTTSKTIWPFKVDNYRWSNREEWIAAMGEETLHDLFALNTKTFSSVRLTFSKDIIETGANLFLGKPAATSLSQIQPISRLEARSERRTVNGVPEGFDASGRFGSTGQALGLRFHLHKDK